MTNEQANHLIKLLETQTEYLKQITYELARANRLQEGQG